MHDEPNIIMDGCYSHAYPHQESYSRYSAYAHNPYDAYRYMEKGSWCVPNVTHDGSGYPYRSHPVRQDGVDYDVPERLRPPVVPNGRGHGGDRPAGTLADDAWDDDDLLDEDDVTVGEVIVGVALVAVFAVGCVVTARAGLNAIRHLTGLL